MKEERNHWREMRIKIVRGLYMEIGGIGDPCTYCGCPSDTMDHIPPVSFVATMSRMERKRSGMRFRVVPSCRDCNSVLGNRVVESISDRRAIVRDALRRRFKKILAIPEWDEEELSEVSPDMRRAIEASLELKRHIGRRLSFYGRKRQVEGAGSDADR